MISFERQFFSISDVTLKDDYCVNAFEKEVSYLASFDVDRLLAGFRETAGLDTKGKNRYPCWENMLIGGHCAGHYIGAVANAIRTPNCPEANRQTLVKILSELIAGLEECQKKTGTGFIFGAAILDKKNIELQFDNVEKNLTHIITQAWVPWYTMHKLIEGLLGVVELKNDFPELSEKSMAILEGITEWIYKRTCGWNEETRKTVLSIEYGGMNDCLYSYYLCSGNEKALACAKAFDDEALFKQITEAKAGSNVLNGRHANTTIPKFIGALNRYVVTGEKHFLEYAEKFWAMVVNAHTYINGGNSTWEHFGEDNNLYSKLSNCNCETCNSYNMLKLTKLLYVTTGKKIYTDWYEHTYINSILSSQNPETGMTTYFQPMASGYFKVYNTPFESFWCCTGTGMENFTKLGESYYLNDRDRLVVNQYLSSEVNWKEKGIRVIQNSSIPNGNYTDFVFTGRYTGSIAFRLPQWLSDKAEIILNGKYYEYAVEEGFALVSGSFDETTTLRLILPMKIEAFNLPDQKDAYSFKYGPVVLCALLGEHDGKTAINGVNVFVPEKAVIPEEYIPSKTDIVTVKNMTVEDFISNINDNLVRNDNPDKLEFILKNTDSKLVYTVHYSQYTQRYGLYFRFLDEKSSKDFMEDKLSQGYINANKLDTVQPGYGQYENDELHNMTEYGTGSTGQTYRGTSRYAKEGGSFSYRMIVDKKGTDLLVMFDPKDNGRGVRITAGTQVIYEERIACQDLKGFNKVSIPLPEAVLKNQVEKVLYQGKEYYTVKIEICGWEGERSAQICEFMYTLRK